MSAKDTNKNPEHISSDSSDENDDLLVFAEEDELTDDDFSSSTRENSVTGAFEGYFSCDVWKVLIVDDDEEVHRVTRLVLRDFFFMERKLEFLSAYNGSQARSLIKDNPDMAVILLDVVMEEDHTGLELVKYIRKDIQNSFVRLILRTGQPGQAPEESVVREYDINDYKAKAELTSQKLFTTMISSLRSYNDIITINDSKVGLEKIIKASSSIFELQTLKRFASVVLEQLIHILKLNKDTLYSQSTGFATSLNTREFHIIAATGEFEPYLDKSINELSDLKVKKEIEASIEHKSSYYHKNKYIGFFSSKLGSESVIFIEAEKELSTLDKKLIDVFCTNVSISYDNILLKQEIDNTQRDIILKLGDIIEKKSHETGGHVRRVAEYCAVIGKEAGLTDEQIHILQLASPMHDVGKIGIADTILNKPSGLTDKERSIIEAHTLIGYDILKNSERRIIKAASIIALQHHENWDGSGYPGGLKGDEIHLYARIVSLVDVFDALICDRVYRKAYDVDYIKHYFEKNKGIGFDPELVTILLDKINILVRIKNENMESGFF